jgi:hypothetical protein
MPYLIRNGYSSTDTQHVHLPKPGFAFRPPQPQTPVTADGETIDAHAGIVNKVAVDVEQPSTENQQHLPPTNPSGEGQRGPSPITQSSSQENPPVVSNQPGDPAGEANSSHPTPSPSSSDQSTSATTVHHQQYNNQPPMTMPTPVPFYRAPFYQNSYDTVNQGYGNMHPPYPPAVFPTPYQHNPYYQHQQGYGHHPVTSYDAYNNVHTTNSTFTAQPVNQERPLGDTASRTSGQTPLDTSTPSRNSGTTPLDSNTSSTPTGRSRGATSNDPIGLPRPPSPARSIFDLDGSTSSSAREVERQASQFSYQENYTDDATMSFSSSSREFLYFNSFFVLLLN